MGLDMGAFEQAWALLKALPEQQMFTERSARSNINEELYDEFEHLPEIDHYGARSHGTVHPIIHEMLKRREAMSRAAVEKLTGPLSDKLFPTLGLGALNLNEGREHDKRIQAHADASDPESHPLVLGAGTSIATGPQELRARYEDDIDIPRKEYPTLEELSRPPQIG